MAKEQGYQGWKNYETWAVKLWIDNEESTYRYWNEASDEAWESREEPFSWESSYEPTPEERAKSRLADRLKDEIDENMPEAINTACQGTMYADLLNAALSEVDWREIAESLLEDAKERATA